MIYTIGYQAITLKELLSTMKEKGIDLLVDVRSVPYSRLPEKYEFNRNRLSEALGKRYVWKGDFCGGKHGKAKEKCMLDLIDMERDKDIMLMCMESHPCDCHRFYDIGLRLLLKGIESHHLISGGGVRTEYTTTELKEVCDARRKGKGSKKSLPF